MRHTAYLGRQAHDDPTCCMAPCHARAAVHDTSRSHPPPMHPSAHPRSHPQHEQIFRLLLKISVGVTHSEQLPIFSPCPAFRVGRNKIYFSPPSRSPLPIVRRRQLLPTSLGEKHRQARAMPALVLSHRPVSCLSRRIWRPSQAAHYISPRLYAGLLNQ